MSYLPNMSKTYKEPRPLPIFEEPNKEITFNDMPPASSLLNEKTLNPRMILKQYHYYAHAPPVLPGPSVLEEALWAEKQQKKWMKKLSQDSIINLDETIKEPSIPEEPPQELLLLEEDDEKSMERTDSSSKRSLKSSRSSTQKRRVPKRNMELKKKDSASTSSSLKNYTVLTTAKASPEVRSARRVSSKNQSKKSPRSKKGSSDVEVQPPANELTSSSTSTQCNLFAKSEKLTVMPSVINSMLRLLSFLLQELSKESKVKNGTKEMKKLRLQTEMTLAVLCNQDTEENFVFDTFYTDARRLQDIARDVRKYIEQNYGVAEKFSDKIEDKKRLITESFEKDYELAVLKEKFEDNGFLESLPEIDATEYLAPEVTLQDKILENQQLRAELEFNNLELRKYHQRLAKNDWEIKTSQEKIMTLKRKLDTSSVSKNDSVGRKSSSQRLSAKEMKIFNKGNKPKEKMNAN